MQGFVAFLEKYIEWIAISLGGLFFLCMVYAYVISSPVAEQVGQHQVTILKADEYVRDNQGEKLVAAMDDQTQPELVVENFSNAVNKSLSMDSSSQLTMVAGVPFQPITLPMSAGQISSNPVVEALPTLPAAVPVAVATGHTTVLMNPAGAPMQVPAGMVPPGMGGPGAAPANGGVKKDIDWATAIFMIPVAPLADQWTQCFGPAKPGDAWKLILPINTEFLMATLYRQEKDANGKWTNPQPIARLFNNPLPDYPAPNNREAENAYRKWAENYQPSIITPPFPDIAAAPSGTVWEPPLQIIQEIINPALKPSPMQPAVTPFPSAAPIPPRPYPQPGPRTGLRGPAGAISNVPGYSATPGRTAPRTPTPTPTPTVTPLPPESTEAHVVAAPGVTLTVPPTTMNPTFDPTGGNGQNGVNVAPNGNILVFLHDDSIRPGTTYRYCLDYKLLNPLFDKLAERAKDAKWVDQLDLVSPMSDVTQSAVITPEGRLFFYCGQQSQPLERGLPFPFEIITWADGFWQRQVFKVNPGDPIGGVSAEGVDYSTGYTYVDGRTVSGHFMVCLLDPSGNVVVRDAEKDYNSTDRKTHNQMVDASKPPAVAPR